MNTSRSLAPVRRAHTQAARGHDPRARQETDAATENPGGGGVLLALVAAALAGGGVYLYMNHRANTAAITDPAQIIMAKVNLAQLAAGPTGSQGIVYTRDQPMSSATPAFAQGLAQFQVALNKMVTPDKLAGLQKEVGQVPLPPLPLRTDGVLDRPTFDWLIYAQG